MSEGGTTLIVNADDYGLTPGISRGILAAHRNGIVTSTSVLAVGRALPEAGSWLADAPLLGVGVHLALVGRDPPILSAREIPSLVDRRGRLAHSWKHFALKKLVARVDPDDVERELTAQIERVRSFRRTLTHVDAHQHIHLWPSIRPCVIRVAQRLGIRGIRVPHSGGKRTVGRIINSLAVKMERAAHEVRLYVPAASYGFDESGHLDEARLLSVLNRTASERPRSAELIVHPGLPDDSPRRDFAWGYEWARELDALRSPAVRRRVSTLGFTLSRYLEREGGDRVGAT